MSKVRFAQTICVAGFEESEGVQRRQRHCASTVIKKILIERIVSVRSAAALTEALRLKQVGLLHANVATPGQEVGGVVASEEGTWRGVPFTCNLPRGKELSGKMNPMNPHDENEPGQMRSSHKI